MHICDALTAVRELLIGIADDCLERDFSLVTGDLLLEEPAEPDVNLRNGVLY